MSLSLIIGPIVTGVTSVFKGLMGLKTEQANVVGQAVNTLGTVAGADAQSAEATASAIAALYQNGGWLERNWRPAFMWMCITLITARWFGYAPPHMPQSEVAMIYQFMEMGLIGYGTLRSMDKWLKGFQIGSLLQKFIEKKVL